MRRREWKRVVATLAGGILVLAACAGTGSDSDEDGADVTTSTSSPDAAPAVGSGAPACDRLSEDAVSFAAGGAFVADVDSATERTCRYRREATVGDSINLSVTASDVDPAVQLDALATSPASSETFRPVDLGDGGFFAVIDGRPHAGVFVDGELIELVLVVEDTLDTATPPDEVLLTLLREAAVS